MPVQRSGRPLGLELQVQGSNLSPPSSLRSCVTLSKFGPQFIQWQDEDTYGSTGFLQRWPNKAYERFTTGP